MTLVVCVWGWRGREGEGRSGMGGRVPDVVQASRASPRLAKVVCFMYVCVVVVVMKIQAPSLRTISVGGSHSRSLCPLHPLLQRAELPLSLSRGEIVVSIFNERRLAKTRLLLGVLDEARSR